MIQVQIETGSMGKFEGVNVNYFGQNFECVPVVKCKDCIYNDDGICEGDGLGVDDEYYCASGHKRPENKE